jgi:hypothetical protein
MTSPAYIVPALALRRYEQLVTRAHDEGARFSAEAWHGLALRLEVCADALEDAPGLCQDAPGLCQRLLDRAADARARGRRVELDREWARQMAERLIAAIETVNAAALPGGTLALVRGGAA